MVTTEVAFRGIAPRDSDPLILRQRNHDLLFFANIRDDPPWNLLRIPEEVHWCPIFGRFKISQAQIERLGSLLKARRRPVRLIVTVDGAHFLRQQMKRWLSFELQQAGVRVTEDAEAAVYLFCIEEAYYIGFPYCTASDAPLRAARRIERPGSLPPTIAAAMAFSGKPSAGDVILDPVCGSGTLLAEAYAYAPDARLIGVDTDAAALRAARENLSHMPDIVLINRSGASTGLPSASVTLFLANLPFGKQYGDRSTNPQLYRELLAEMDRLGVPGKWRAVLLSSDMEALDSALTDRPGFTIDKRIWVAVRGEKATLVVLHASVTS